ncbi:LD-carboxypeptidase LdcB, LAS superfamily [Pedococcus dokdonensis]|uniref:LD-carboxypeptidase LdcB, LAS superfamily n=1 Tax=Pedococcus dokdonensis TaxID=443156 RepID=A0A1H0T9R3_9MICO|nr:D-alanyl-D-alanine carboxypeptidase family protein [Pedococcus dokdonensis]SDP50793.1 LD-carboxypeptidase LdcB, LAS superfamily [Pedococcus dokdonensis]
MVTTTHVSAGRRRRQRLRRTLVVTALLVAAAGTAGYAAWHDDATTPTAAAGQAVGDQVRGAPTQGSPKTSKPKVASTRASPKPKGRNGFAPVMTDRIPAPTTSLALSAAVPGTTNMQPSAAGAFERAFADARVEGLDPEIRSAWRSEQWQQVLFDRAVAKYGSEVEAGKWVLSPGRSAHVKGYAIDVHPRAMAAWLETRGTAYGICRTYDNEWWHFEYLATSTCPARQPTAAG